jgi:indole-3-glycerol phosphate synthase
VILDEIVAAKRQEVAACKKRRGMAALQAAIAGTPAPRDFMGALHAASGGVAVIAEIKRRSPSKGLLCTDFAPEHIARVYEENGAAALSVLTDAPFFGGSPAHLHEARAAVALPVLRKDFLIDAWQLYESRAIGADAVLLIAAVLPDGRLAEYASLAGELGMAALVEVHDRQELDRAVAAGAGIIGINNRDLRTFVTDIAVTVRLAPHAPTEKTIVSESGIRGRGDVETLMGAGVRAFLVGETLMRAADAGAALRELMGR